MKALLFELKQLLIDALDLEDLSPDDIGDDTLLFSEEGLALDSIDALELGIALRKKYSLQLTSGDDQVREHFRSLHSLAEFVRSQTIETH